MIFFTTASGAGYGMMILLALLASLDVLPKEPVFGLATFGLALALIVSGLLSSTMHLGRPERAWRALSQWRSSWLSREGLAAVVAFVPFGLFAISWSFNLVASSTAVVLGVAGAAVSLVTLYCTAMIYASLRPVPAWFNGWTVAGYLVLGPMNGAVILAFLLDAFAAEQAAAITRLFALVLLMIGLGVKLAYWRRIHASTPVSTAGSATGLGHLGRVEMTGSPHDNDNYLLREMGFRIARKHADKLRRITVSFGFVIPMLAMAIGLVFPSAPWTLSLMVLGLIACQIGVATERWLFFAEAKHAVTLYYGEQAV
ncbi:dimethyl sulfoxide reductase anchor subunit family protein [Qipengyuania gaetbuli]|uniref:dimethyl sulfoxide reductase anchor subunit family protein n=1 Tax=Qipengyuania gaetbuli TaxID=266952 RepID=UPI00296B4C7E|nr:DmsC/YnfH family molybdoenzyme membrane anchor subunit [Qipengyuania gaetbuli]